VEGGKFAKNNALCMGGGLLKLHKPLIMADIYWQQVSNYTGKSTTPPDTNVNVFFFLFFFKDKVGQGEMVTEFEQTVFNDGAETVHI